jgi:hypothetical protein
MFCRTRKAEVKDQFDLADDFNTNRFPSRKSYPPSSGVTFQLTSRTYGFIPEAHLLDCAHTPTINTTIMLNSKLTQMYWRLVDWDLWGCSATELNATKLLTVFKFVHKEWPTGHMLHRYHNTDAGSHQCGKYDEIEHIFTCPSLAASQGRTSALADM